MSEQVLKSGNVMERSRTRTITQIAMLGALAGILMNFEFPLPFLAPSFYQLDFSEIPVLVGAFAMGPIAGILIEVVKVLVHLVTMGTMTAGVGDFANFIFGCAFVVPAGLIYKKKHNRTGAIVGMISGTLFMTILGCFLNAYVLLPAYAKAFQMPMDALVGMGTAVNSHITSVTTLVIFAIVPFNLLKGVLVSLIVFLIYKKISPIFHMGR